MDNKLGASGGDEVHLLETAHLDAGGFSGKANNVGNNPVSGREVDNQFVVFDGTVVVSQLQKDRGNFIEGVTVNNITLVIEVIEKRTKKELHDGKTEFFVGLEEFLEFRDWGSINLDGSESLKVVDIAMIGDSVDDGKSEERSKKVDSIFPLGSNGISAGKTRFIEEDMSKLVSGIENDFSLGVFLNRKLGEKLFDFGEFSFGHRQLVIIYHKNIL